MIRIDGSSGGGQMLRTSLSLSALQQESFKITDIRGSRKQPGLKNQHITAVKTIKQLTDAETKGLKPGSETLVFRPDKLRRKPVSQNIGTAGSATLLFDTLLPLSAKIGLEGTLIGGTDVKWSPTSDYLKHVKLPFLEKLGLNSRLDIKKTGYYPKGGGKLSFNLKQSSLNPIIVEDRGRLQKIELYSKASQDLANADVAERQALKAKQILDKNVNNVSVEKNSRYVDSESTGSSLLIKAVYENTLAGFDTLGESGKPAEKVAEDAVNDFLKFNSSNAVVDEHMADQLMSLVYGTNLRLDSSKSSHHIKNNLKVLKAFNISAKITEGKLKIN